MFYELCVRGEKVWDIQKDFLISNLYKNLELDFLEIFSTQKIFVSDKNINCKMRFFCKTNCLTDLDMDSIMKMRIVMQFLVLHDFPKNKGGVIKITSV